MRKPMDFEEEARLIENDAGIQRNRRENHPSQLAKDCGITCMECVFDVGLAVFFPVYEWCCKPWNAGPTGWRQQQRSSYGNLVPSSDMDMQSEVSFQPLIDDTGDEVEPLDLGHHIGNDEHGPNSRYYKEDPVFEDGEM